MPMLFEVFHSHCEHCGKLFEQRIQVNSYGQPYGGGKSGTGKLRRGCSPVCSRRIGMVGRGMQPSPVAPHDKRKMPRNATKAEMASKIVSLILSCPFARECWIRLGGPV